MFPTTDSTATLDAFADEHEALDRNLSALRGLLAERLVPRATVSTLAELCNHVISHFDHEEQEDGFFDNVVDQAPRLQQRASALIEEHADMAAALTDMRLYAANHAQTDIWWSGMNMRFEAFWKQFLEHEQTEIDLIQEAFFDDIGEAD